MAVFIIRFIQIILVSSLLASADASPSLTLSLDEAILLAVRKNPSVKSNRLDYIEKKFALYIQEWQFYPHYGLTVSANSVTNQTGPEITRSRTVQFNPSVSLNTPYGTTMTLGMTNTATTHYRPGLQLDITQPLNRGFGKNIVQAALNNARDTLVVARLQAEQVLRETITSVIDAYLDVVSAEQTVKIDEEALKRAEQSVEQTKKFIKAGRKAGNELVTVKANVATANAQLINDKNMLMQYRYALLTAIGIDPNTEVQFTTIDFAALLKKYNQPTLEETKTLVIQNNTQYQTDIITFNGATKRNLLTAIDGTKAKIDLTVNAVTGNDGISSKNNETKTDDTDALPSLWNGLYQGQTIGITFTIPIDDQAAKQQVLSAKIAIKQAEILMQKNRWSIETDAINTWNSVLSAERSLSYAKEAQELQTKTYNISYQKYLYGLIDSLELQSAQVQLIQAQQSLLQAQVNYIKSLVKLDAIIGRTLKTWQVQVRLG